MYKYLTLMLAGTTLISAPLMAAKAEEKSNNKDRYEAHVVIEVKDTQTGKITKYLPHAGEAAGEDLEKFAKDKAVTLWSPPKSDKSILQRGIESAGRKLGRITDVIAKGGSAQDVMQAAVGQFAKAVGDSTLSMSYDASKNAADAAVKAAGVAEKAAQNVGDASKNIGKMAGNIKSSANQTQKNTNRQYQSAEPMDSSYDNLPYSDATKGARSSQGSTQSQYQNIPVSPRSTSTTRDLASQLPPPPSHSRSAGQLPPPPPPFDPSAVRKSNSAPGKLPPPPAQFDTSKAKLPAPIATQ